MSLPKRSGEFFIFSTGVAAEIVKAGGNVEEIMALLILYRGAGMFASSKWTENAIAKHGGFTYNRACKATSFLKAHGFIEEKAAINDIAKNEAGNRWKIIKTTANFMYMPNSLIDGIGGGKEIPPLRRLYQGIETKLTQGIDAHVARLDAIILLLSFYESQDISQYGGINPLVWSRPWIPANNDEFIDATLAIDGSNGALFEIEKGKQQTSDSSVLKIFFYIKDEERLPRYWHAVANIKRLNLVYEVIQIWDADPTLANNANIMYPLYFFDQRARESEPCVYREINSLAFEFEGSERFFESDGTANFGETISTFRFVGLKDRMAVAVSVLRLRYRAHDRDTGFGMDDQEKKANDWKLAIKSLMGK